MSFQFKRNLLNFQLKYLNLNNQQKHSLQLFKKCFELIKNGFSNILRTWNTKYIEKLYVVIDSIMLFNYNLKKGQVNEPRTKMHSPKFFKLRQRSLYNLLFIIFNE
ncbi:unnamed protein product [Paramecium primaurelia]|uniref:Uncharacterized protein n=1 Tax=Paramecium primaurelia TaxID=5886 RepID=A0A8S1JSE0_PARPR|nr:unnamed protein product [Paramecium primaurelia]